MAGKHFRVECICELAGGWRQAKVGRTGIVLPRGRDVSVGELAVALPDEALSLCARGRVSSSLGWHGGGG
jgi:hypothetical protein